MQKLLSAMLIFGTFTLASSGVNANGLGENRAWQFQTSADRANNAIVRDMIERKKGGYYDSYDTIINNTTNTTIEGDQINCNVAPNAIGSQSGSTMDSVTSSPEVSPGSDIHVDATGNEAENTADGKGDVDNDQQNKGDQSASASDLDSKVGSVNASGGTTSQVLNNTQKNTGNQQASVTDSQACSFVDHAGGKKLN